jgi:hypothetical protein
MVQRGCYYSLHGACSAAVAAVGGVAGGLCCYRCCMWQPLTARWTVTGSAECDFTHRLCALLRFSMSAMYARYGCGLPAMLLLHSTVPPDVWAPLGHGCTWWLITDAVGHLDTCKVRLAGS